MDTETIKSIKEDFEFLKQDKRVLSLLLFGSKANKKDHSKSDADICIVAPDQDQENREQILSKISRNLDTKNKNYDIHFFKELPLYIKIKVMNNHRIIFTQDKLEMHEHFYQYRKLWKDQKKRNTMTKEQLKKPISK